MQPLKNFTLFVSILICFLLLPLFSGAQNSVRFAAIGDFGDVNSNVQQVADLVHSLEPEFIITMGDNNYGAPDYEDKVAQYYGTFIGGYSGAYSAGPSVGSNKFFPCLGNHDWDDAGLSNYLSFFNLPGIATSSSGNERYYDFVYGPVHFFCIDSDPQEPHGRTSTSTQAQWLRTQLAASPYCWKVVYMHNAPYSSSVRHGSDPVVQWPFEDWGADVVMAGHDHTYERILRDDNNDGKQMPYFVCGTGGRSIYAFLSIGIVEGSQSRIAKTGAMIITASETSMQFQFWKVEGGGVLSDSFTLSKICTFPNCTDNNTCTRDTMINGRCAYPTITCTDDNACTADACENGQCIFGPPNCNDDNPCTIDSCSDGACSNTAIICNDNIACTADACVNGICLYNSLCNDNNSCTTDGCTNGQCVYTQIANCNCALTINSLTLINSSTDADLRVLKTTDTINLAVTPNVNVRANPCQLPIGSVKFVLNGSTLRTESSIPFALAGDASGDYAKWNVSTGLYTLSAIPYSGSGASGTAGTAKTITIRVINQQAPACTSNANCNDNNPCTNDACQSGQCVNAVINCNDNNPCTTDNCSSGVCTNVLKVCNDNSLCTTDACVNGNCVYTAINCNDNNSCTNDGCSAGQCTHTTLNCNDNNPCTTDGCNTPGGCSYVTIPGCCTTAANCSDNNPCTIDACTANTCTYTQGGNQPSYLRIVNPAKSWRKLKMGYSTNSFYSPKLNVTASGNNTLCITLRSVGTPVWSKIQIRPMGSSGAAVPLGNYVSGSVSEWTTVCIPLSAFSGINFTQLTFLEVPYSNGAAAFEIHIQKIVFSGGTTPFLWFGDPHTSNIHDGQSGSNGALIATLLQGSPCSSKTDNESLVTGDDAANISLVAFPNPFSEKLNIEFSLQNNSFINLEFFNLSGQRLSAFSNEVKASELQHYEFIPAGISAGVVIYRLETEAGTFYGKAVIVK